MWSHRQFGTVSFNILSQNEFQWCFIVSVISFLGEVYLGWPEKQENFLWRWIFLSDSSWLSHTRMNWLYRIYDHKTSSDGKLFLWGNWQDAVKYTPLSCRLRCQVMLLQSTPYGGRSLVNIVWWFISFLTCPFDYADWFFVSPACLALRFVALTPVITYVRSRGDTYCHFSRVEHVQYSYEIFKKISVIFFLFFSPMCWFDCF